MTIMFCLSEHLLINGEYGFGLRVAGKDSKHNPQLETRESTLCSLLLRDETPGGGNPKPVAV
jgi:hypothetical protein